MDAAFAAAAELLGVGVASRIIAAVLAMRR